MLVLAVETATDLAGVALADDEGVLGSASVGRGRRHGESIAPAVSFVCRSAGVSPMELDALAVDLGPGLFTGLRVGVATAQALAFALGRPVVGVGSLELVAAAPALGAPAGTVVVSVVDARRGRLFWCAYRVGGVRAPASVLEPFGEETLGTIEELLAALDAIGEPNLVAGDGARRHAAVLAARPGTTVAAPGFDHPDPALLAVVGVSRMAAGAGEPAASVRARYLREPDVRINWEQRRSPRPVAGPAGRDR